ncbi:MAG: hypothetical protein ND895_06725 [Pyrinomonadaceae bacterium]|nr:hypothetical protein [Pyrinomonadaceae bacterium]
MVDEEVEKTLREIRERVRKTTEIKAAGPVTVVSSATNGSHTLGNASEPKTAETMARIDAYLTTTARAWDRLPPLVSNRSGGLARLELWVKRRFKQATRWYSWEQINFNAAVHHALRDTLEALLDLERQLAATRAKMEAQLEQHQIDLMTQRAEIETQRAEIESQRAEIDSRRAEMEVYRAQIEAQQRARNLELNARLAESLERDEQRLDEQRVCFKQLSLEISEATVLLDRARRDIESRLNKLESSK